MDPIIRIENLSKQYRLGNVGTGTLSHDLNRWWANIRGKEDPFLKIGETNTQNTKGNSDYVWALKDINLEVMPGEVLGIIGKNGAGKSTLLKLLSRVTAPTTGSIKARGRIASLLEVGTGFHPELTGRENIFLNGAILGMTKAEIRSRFEEIVDFAGVERYIETPVKRYSSGMYVRLAFAVAAHLEPEILVVDEVLAVGDAEFQKKAIGKMQDISKGEGRTVLFVSHNMTAIETLCTHSILLQDGKLKKEGNPSDMIKYYLDEGSLLKRKISYDDLSSSIGNEYIRILYAAVENATADDKNDLINIKSAIDIRFKIVNLTNNRRISVGFDLKTVKGEILFGSGGKFNCEIGRPTELVCHIPANFLNDELYNIHAYFHTESMACLFSNKELLTFEVKDIERDLGYLGKINGYIRPILHWSTSCVMTT